MYLQLMLLWGFLRIICKIEKKYKKPEEKFLFFPPLFYTFLMFCILSVNLAIKDSYRKE